MEMAFRKPSRRAARLLLALLLAGGLMLAGSAAAPQHALAAPQCSVQTFGKLLIDGQTVTQVIVSPLAGTCTNQVIAHNCATMGGNGGVSALECVDIYMTWNSSAVEAWSEGEYYCQGGGYARCAAMFVNQVFYWDANTGSQRTFGHPGGSYVCSGSGCPSGATATTGRAWVDTYHYSGSQSTAASECTVPIIAKAQTTNSITVPDGDKITYPKGVSTSLISVCFGG